MDVVLIDAKWGGHHTPFAVYLSRYLCTQSHNIRFITDHKNPRVDEFPPDVKIIKVKLPDRDNIEFGSFSLLETFTRHLWRTRQLEVLFDKVEEMNVDVVHLLYYDNSQLAVWLSHRLHNFKLPPVVATLHRDHFTETGGSFYTENIKQSLVSRVISSSVRRGDINHITVLASSIYSRLIDNVSELNELNTHTIFAPTPNDKKMCTTSEARIKLNLPGDRPILLYFGRLAKEKGPDLLMNALTGLDRPVTIVFAGAEAQFTQQDINQWKSSLGEHIHVIDRIKFIPEPNVMTYFKAADILVLPYRRRRGISGPLRLAARAEIPVIGNADSDVGKLIEQYGLGWTFTNGSTTGLRRAIRDALDYNSTTNAQFDKFVEERDWKKVGEDYEQLYLNCKE